MGGSITLTLKEVVELLVLIVGIASGYIKLEKRITKLEDHDEAVWGELMKRLGESLHRPTHYEMDILLERFPNLTDSELAELKLMIEEEYKEARKGGDKGTAIFALYLTGIKREVDKRQRRLSTGILPKLKHLICGG